MTTVKQMTPSKASNAPRYLSAQLLGPGGQAVILHKGREYRLRVTQSGKLILTA